jgi:hypothetical protein
MDRLERLSGLEKRALPRFRDMEAALDEAHREDDREAGVVEPETYHNPETFSEITRHNVDRIKRHIQSFLRGVVSANGVAALRGGQTVVNMAGWLPRMADELVFGRLMGVGGGKGLTGRLSGKFNRYMDEKVHGMRQWSSDFDERYRIGGGLNRFMNGAAADVVGGFAGLGGLAGLIRRSPATILTAGGFGGLSAYVGGAKELRDRERWLRSLDPLDRVGIDATSTPTNQEDAPTLEEYRRYHMPSGPLPTSGTGFIRIPRSWGRLPNGRPVQFRDFGT